jgi:hypothetical protein
LHNQAPAAINARVNDLAEKPCSPWCDPWRLCLASVIIVAVVIRIIDASLRWPIADRDMFVFLQQARSLLQGDWYSWFAIHTKPPLYSLLVALPAALGMELLPAGKLISLLAGIAILHLADPPPLG